MGKEPKGKKGRKEGRKERKKEGRKDTEKARELVYDDERKKKEENL